MEIQQKFENFKKEVLQNVDLPILKNIVKKDKE